jgi:hypothetical protein
MSRIKSTGKVLPGRVSILRAAKYGSQMIRAVRRHPGRELGADFHHHRRIHLKFIELDLHELPKMALRAFHAQLRVVLRLPAFERPWGWCHVALL